MSTLTRIYTRPIFKVEMSLSFELGEEKVVTLEEGLLYTLKYIKPVAFGENVIKEITGRLSKIKLVPNKVDFNPFYNGEVYNLLFDCSEDFHSVQIEIPTTYIRDIDLYEVPEEDTELEQPEDNESVEDSTSSSESEESTESSESESTDPSTSESEEFIEPEGSETPEEVPVE